jgi:quercetin 2,3-dioxygenase
MAWNFVVRTLEELAAAEDAWRDDDGRFGTVRGHDGPRIPLPGG